MKACVCFVFFFSFKMKCTTTALQDLEELIVQAREMLRKIPANFLQTVRSCCSDQCNAPLDTSRSLFCESVRYCYSLSVFVQCMVVQTTRC